MNDRQKNTVERLSEVDIDALPEDGGERFNRLIFEKSPYLLQHAENPIAWYSWGDRAFAAAREEDRPIFLSIGYSTCHWCHVMEQESFEDRKVADILNRSFVAIKVDREERPDIDGTYMAVCQMMTGSGGWPLNLILAPDKKPFFAATYIPRESRGEMVGLCDLLRKVAELWQTERSRLLQTGEEVGRALRAVEQSEPGSSGLDPSVLEKAFSQYLATFDRQHAGFATPKFPSAHNLSLLLRFWQRTGQHQARQMALRTLQNVRLGGIYDQIGYGVHRYAVDAAWRIPHFEKMLYDQALATLAYLDAWQVTADSLYAQTACEILEYVLRDLGHPEGGFYCGEDADSEGAEGTFYLWRPEEIHDILGREAATVFCRSYGITPEGNFEGKSVPFLEEDIDSLARRTKVEPGELSALLADSRRRLFQTREKRPRPHRDDKIITSWNGLAIAALARAGAVLERDSFIGKAEEAAEFILDRLRDRNGRLLRRFRRDEAAVFGFHEDYAFFIWGLIELYQARFSTRHLQLALDLARQVEELFSDEDGGYFDTGADAETVLVRGRSLQDGALPSAASVTALNLLRLGALTGETDHEKRAEKLLGRCLGQVERYPSAFGQFLMAVDYALGPRSEVVIATSSREHLPGEMLAPLRSRFLPRNVTLVRRPDDEELPRLAPVVRGKEPPAEGAMAYLCHGRSCREPVTDPRDLEALLDEISATPERE